MQEQAGKYWVFISIHALREEGDLAAEVNFFCPPLISIHALREEGDQRRKNRMNRNNISIHALREEGDMVSKSMGHGSNTFLSTPSARRATSTRSYRPAVSRHFYPRPPRGGRRMLPYDCIGS